MDVISKLLTSTASKAPNGANIVHIILLLPQLILMGCLNFTSGNETMSGRHPYYVQISVSLMILVGILILLTAFGNVTMVIAVITSPTLSALHNLFLVYLACAAVATLVMPLSLANELMLDVQLLLHCWSFQTKCKKKSEHKKRSKRMWNISIQLLTFYFIVLFWMPKAHIREPSHALLWADRACLA